MTADDEGDEPPEKHAKRLANPTAKCPRHPQKDWRQLVERAWEAGWWCEQRTKYIRCWPPDHSREAVSLPSTPRGGRTLMNYTKKMERSGLPKRNC